MLLEAAEILAHDDHLRAEIDHRRQVEMIAGPYEPVYRIDGITCWPSEPFWDQVVDGPAIKARLDAKKMSIESHWCLEKTGTDVLELGTHFDVVVLGIALGAFKKLNAEPTMCDELYAANPRFRRMAEGLGLVPTQAFQLWTKPDLRGLGFAAANLGAPAMNAAPSRSSAPTMPESMSTLMYALCGWTFELGYSPP